MTNNSKGNAGSATQATPEGTGFINQWGGKLAFFFTCTHLSHDLTVGLVVALLPFIREDLGLNYLQAGFMVSAYAITSGFSQFLGGWLSGRLGRRKAIALGLGGVGLSAVAIGFAPSYYAVVSILIAMGIFAGFYHPSAIPALTVYFEEQQRGRVLALHMLGGSLGFGIGPFLGAIIASSSNWHLAFILLGLPALVAAALVFTYLKSAPPIKQSEETVLSQMSGQKPVSVWQVYKSVARIILISTSMQLITGPVMSFLPLFLVDVHHLSTAAGSMWLTIIRMAGLVGGLFGGWLTDKWGRRNSIFLSLILFGPAVFLLAKMPFGAALIVAFILFGWLMTMRETTVQTYLMDNTPPQTRAKVVGVYGGFGQQGSSVIQPVAGNFMDMVGIGGVFNTIAVISIGLSVLSIAAVYGTAKRMRTRSKSIGS